MSPVRFLPLIIVALFLTSFARAERVQTVSSITVVGYSDSYVYGGRRIHYTDDTLEFEAKVSGGGFYITGARSLNGGFIEDFDFSFTRPNFEPVQPGSYKFGATDRSRRD